MKIKSDPFQQGLDRAVALHLLKCTRATEKRIQAQYHRTEHWKRLVEAAVALYKSCVMCGRPGENGSLTVHHRTYKNLFSEDLCEDVVLVCQRCHRRYHGK